MAIIERIMGWGLLGATAAAGLILLAWGIWRLIQWLASSTEGGGQPIDIGRYLKSLWLALWERLPEDMAPTRVSQSNGRAFTPGCWPGVEGEVSPPRPGKRRGIWGGGWESTILSLKGISEQIVESFNGETYGELVLLEEQVASAREAWRRLSSPFARLPSTKIKKGANGPPSCFNFDPGEFVIQSSSSSARVPWSALPPGSQPTMP